MRYGQLVMGPAGSGKSTYCSTIVEHCEAIGRSVHVVNLDPAAEVFDYPVAWDIRDVVSVDDVAEALNFGPNGGLVYCMEYLMSNIQLLDDALGDYSDDYLIFDCPGQIELYTHIPVMKQLVDHLHGQDYRVAGVYLIDAQFIDDPSKFFAACLSAISVMMTLAIPHVNILTKMDLMKTLKKRSEIERFLDPDPTLLLQDVNVVTGSKQHRLNKAIASLLEDYSLLKFVPLDRSKEESIQIALQHVDNCIQFGEDDDVKIAPDPDEQDEAL